MAVATFPGVFVQEVPSGVRTITGVPTSITAFVGQTGMGPINAPTIINNFGDFGRIFGGLNAKSSVSYAVRDFFQNGGGQAVVVRLFQLKTSPPSTEHADGVATVTFPTTSSPPATLVLRASNPGTWGNGLAVTLTVLDQTNSGQLAQLKEIATQLGLDNTVAANLNSIFNLTITSGGVTETIPNVTFVPSLRTVTDVLKVGNSASQFVEFDATSTATSATDATTLKSLTDSHGVLIPSKGTGGGDSAALGDTTYVPTDGSKTGIFALDKTDIFNILCIPPDTRLAADISWADTDNPVFQAAASYCVTRRAMLLIDPPHTMTISTASTVVGTLALAADQARNSAMYFPRVIEADPLNGGRTGNFVSCGAVAGIMATTDGARGVWKAPAGIDAAISGIQGLSISITDAENGQINPIGVNALRTFPIIGSVVWGARTLRGADLLADDYKYVPVRRFALFLEESLVRGLKFAVFEPNDEPLWAQIRLNVGAFLNNLFRQGAFQGKSPRDAYFVKADSETTTQNDINLGIVNVLVGFAPLKPAEFVIIKIQQIAGQVTT